MADGRQGEAAESGGGRLLERHRSARLEPKIDRGTEEHPVSQGISGSAPVWSPSGEMLLFWSGPPAEAGGLRVIDVSKSRLWSLTRTQAAECCYAWSADGDRIFFARELSDGWTLHSIDPDGSDERQLGRIDGDPPYSFGPVWSPDGERGLFDRTLEEPGNDEPPFGNEEIFVANSDGTDVQNLTHSDASDGSATWSPDGEQIAFVRHQFGARDRLWVIL